MLELFVVPLQVEVAVLSACALNCVFYERAWLLLFLHSHAGNKLIFHVSHVLTRIFIVCVDTRDTHEGIKQKELSGAGHLPRQSYLTMLHIKHSSFIPF